MEFDYYILYLAIDHVYNERDKKYCQSLDQVGYELNNAVGYDSYIIKGVIREPYAEAIIAYDEIKVNRKPSKKTR